MYTVEYKHIFLKSLLLAAIATLIFLPQANSQVYTLDQVLNRIEQNNPALLAYQKRMIALDEAAKGARAWPAPKTGLEVDMLPYEVTNYSTGSLRFSYMQDFPNPKRNLLRERYMKSMSVSEYYGGEFRKVELFANAKESFFKLYVAKRRISVLQESSDVLQLMIDLATKQLAITQGPLAPVYRLKARLIENETMIIHEKNIIRTYVSNINYLMNDDVNQTWDIDTTGLFRNYRTTNSYLLADSFTQNRSDILKIGSEIQTAKFNQQFISTRNKPDFGARIQHNQRLSNMPSSFSVMGTMTIPSAPWSAKSYKSEVRSLDYRIEAMEEDKRNMINMAMQTVKMYLIELESEYRELDNYSDKIIPAYQKGLDASLLAYGQNTNDMNMTLMAWDDLLMSKMEYLKHLDTYFKIQTEYEKALQIR